MSSIDKLASELNKALQEENARKTSAYDTPAEVLRVDGDTLWVHIPGGVDETPVRRTINATPGDTIQVHIVNGGAWATGNATNPPTDDTKAIEADNRAIEAQEGVKAIGTLAQEARDYADAAKEASDEAKDASAEAKTMAGEVHNIATEAQTEANRAMYNLSIVEQVVNSSTWIAEHATYDITEDTTFNEDKLYFLKREHYKKTEDSTLTEDATYYKIVGAAVSEPSKDHLYEYYELIDGTYILTKDQTINKEKTYYTITATEVDTPDESEIDSYYEKIETYSLYTDKEGSPSELGLYEIKSIDEGVTNYLLSHIALVNEGLYIFSSDGGYKVLITNTDVRIIDTNGNVVAIYGDSISFDNRREYSIGNDSTYIKYYDSNNDGKADSIQIRASSILIGEKAVEEQLDTINTQIDGVSAEIEAQAEVINDNIENVNNQFINVNNELNNHEVVINDALEEISKYSGYIIINPEEPSISVGSDEYSYLKIIPSKLSLVNENKEVVYLSNERLYAPSAVVTNLYMQTIDPVSGETRGNLGWVMRSNGHLSLRPMK